MANEIRKGKEKSGKSQKLSDLAGCHLTKNVPNYCLTRFDIPDFFFNFVVTRFTSVYVCFSFKSAFFYLHHRTLYFYGVRWECKINQNCSQYPELFIILGMLRNSHIFSLNKIRSVFPNVLKLIQFLIFVSGFWNGAQLLGSRRDDEIRIHDHFMMQYRCSLPAREE